jgi:transcriptional regulator with XRE-family HTH domain
VKEAEIGTSSSADDKRQSYLPSAMKMLRERSGLTLQQLSERSGISLSALSKIEKGLLSPTYEKIIALATGLSANISELFVPPQPSAGLGRRSVVKAGSGLVVREWKVYRHQILHSELSGKRFQPFVTTVKANSSQDLDLVRHEGEEFIYVVDGSVVLSTEFYEPCVLEKGDAVYFDSQMRHAVVSANEFDATVLWVWSSANGKPSGMPEAGQ